MQAPGVNSAKKGIHDGLPIALGYLSVSFTFGMMAVAAGLPVWVAVLISMTNLTSAGQFAGLSLITAGASMVEMALTQLTINIRYSLMSLSLSQKLDRAVSLPHRLALSFGITDEIFAVAMGQTGTVGKRYFYGLMLMPYLGWSLGTLAGALAGSVLPQWVVGALGIAIYGMFVAIILPPARHSPAIRVVLLTAVALSCLLHFAPVLNQISSGFAIILCTLAAAALGALLFPLREEKPPAGTDADQDGPHDETEN